MHRIVFRKNFELKYSKIIKFLFSFRIVSKNIFLVAKLFDKIKLENAISRKFFHYLFFLQKVTSIGSCDLTNKKIFKIDISSECREALIVKSNEKVKFSIKNCNYERLNFGISILELETILNKKLYLSDAFFRVKIESDNKIKEFKFQIPIGKKKHGLVTNYSQKGWFDFYIYLNDWKNKDIDISFELNVNKSGFLLHKINVKDDFYQTKNFTFAVSGPTLCSQIKNNQNTKVKKKIIILSIESLTEINYLENKLGIKLNIPNIRKLMNDETNYKNAFTMCDSTMPNLFSLHTGLLPSQHGIADHKCSIYKEIPNKQLNFLGSILKKKNYFNISHTYGPRCDTIKNWNNGYQVSINAASASDDAAPNFDKLKRTLKTYTNDNIFLYFHIDKLHAPFLKMNNIETPFAQNIDDLDEAINNRNFYKIYCSQLERLDEEIGDFFDFLKKKDMYDHSLIIFTADHGNALPPLWVKNSGNSLYEEHIKIPLVIKESNWVNKTIFSNKRNYVSSQSEIYRIILNTLGASIPDYIQKLPQYNNNYKNYAISETIHFPKYNDYKLSIFTEKYQAICSTKINWRSLKRISELNIEIFSKDSFIVSEKEKEKIEKLFSIIIQENLNFKNKFKNSDFKEKYND